LALDPADAARIAGAAARLFRRAEFKGLQDSTRARTILRLAGAALLILTLAI